MIRRKTLANYCWHMPDINILYALLAVNLILLRCWNTELKCVQSVCIRTYLSDEPGFR